MTETSVRPVVARWRDVVVRSGLPRPAVQFAVILTSIMTTDGTSKVGIEKLCGYTHMSEKTVRRWRDRLRAAGLLQWESGAGRSRVTTYFAAIPGEGVATRRGFQLEIPGAARIKTPALRAPTPMGPGLGPVNRVPHEETPADPLRVSAVLGDLRRSILAKAVTNGERAK